MSERPINDIANDLELPDGSRTLVWVRKGRIRLAILGSAAVLAAGGAAAYRAAGDENQSAPSADQTSISK